MNTSKFELIIRFDKDTDEFVFVSARRTARKTATTNNEHGLSVKIPLSRLKNIDVTAAEVLIGESVLGFFDHLSEGALGLKKNYRENGK